MLASESSNYGCSPFIRHYNFRGQAFTQGFHPLSSPINSTNFAVTSDDGDDLPPDLPCTVRFGDILASSFPAGTSGVLHSPTAMRLLSSSEAACSSHEREAKVLSRNPSKPGHKSAINSIQTQQLVDSEGIPVPLSSLSEASCCRGCTVGSPALSEAILALHKFLPSNNDEYEDDGLWSSNCWPALDVYSCDDFRMYEFKVRKCVRGCSHDWTECPFAHPGEKARRRDPRWYQYSGTACPDFRKGNCKRGEACEYSHGVFECWLHPTRYRTQPCKDGKNCRRRVCFFAHTLEQLRVVAPEGGTPPATPGSGSARSSVLKAAALSGGAYDGSPLRRAFVGTLDGSAALELVLDDANKCSAAGCHEHHRHHRIGMGSSPGSTLDGMSAGATSPSPMSSPVLPMGSPVSSSVSSWPVVPGHRKHLDRLRSIPTISIPGSEEAAGSLRLESTCTMAERLSTLEALHLSPGATSSWVLPSNAWPLPSQRQNPLPKSVSSTPRSRYQANSTNVMQVNLAEPVSRPYVITDQNNMAALSFGPLETTACSNENSAVESDVLDLGWVNELVQ